MSQSCSYPHCISSVIGQCVKGYKEPCGRFFCTHHHVDTLCYACYDKAAHDVAVEQLTAEYSKVAEDIDRRKGIYQELLVKLGLKAPQAKIGMTIAIIIIIVLSTIALYTDMVNLGVIGLIACPLIVMLLIYVLPARITMDDNWKTWHRNIKSFSEIFLVGIGIVSCEAGAVGLSGFIVSAEEIGVAGLAVFFLLLFIIITLSRSRDGDVIGKILEEIATDRPDFIAFYAEWKTVRRLKNRQKMLEGFFLTDDAIATVYEYKQKEHIRNDVSRMRMKTDNL